MLTGDGFKILIPSRATHTGHSFFNGPLLSFASGEPAEGSQLVDLQPPPSPSLLRAGASSDRINLARRELVTSVSLECIHESAAVAAAAAAAGAAGAVVSAKPGPARPCEKSWQLACHS